MCLYSLRHADHVWNWIGPLENIALGVWTHGNYYGAILPWVLLFGKCIPSKEQKHDQLS